MSGTPAARAYNIPRMTVVLIAALVFAADQLSKAVVAALIPEHFVVPVLPKCFNLIHVKNPGAAFSLFADSPAPWKTALLIGVSGILLLVVAAVVWRNRGLRWEASLGLALVLGGALSNLVDRIRFGRVVDFLDFYYRTYHWATFNLADSAIVAGAGFLMLQVMLGERRN